MRQIKDIQTHLSDSDIAIVDAIRSVIDILVAANITQPEDLERNFARKRDVYLEKEMPCAFAVMEMLREIVSDPSRPSYAEQQQMLFEDPPEGSA